MSIVDFYRCERCGNIVALIKKINTNQAQALLAGADGSVRAALAA